MSKTADKAVEYIRGTKRLAIIQKWLREQDEPDYEVLPMRKEGKHIVKRREKLDSKNKAEKSDEKTDEEIVDDVLYEDELED